MLRNEKLMQPVSKVLSNGMKLHFIPTSDSLISVGFGFKSGFRFPSQTTPGLTCSLTSELVRVLHPQTMKFKAEYDREAIRMSAFTTADDVSSLVASIAAQFTPDEQAIAAVLPGAIHHTNVMVESMRNPLALRRSAVHHGLFNTHPLAAIDPLLRPVAHPPTPEKLAADIPTLLNPAKGACVIIGNVDPDVVVSQLEVIPAHTPTPPTPVDPAWSATGGQVMAMRLGMPTFTMVWPTEGVASPDFIPLSVLFRALGGCQRFEAGGPGKGMLAALPLLGLDTETEQVQCRYKPYSDAGVFEIFGQLTTSADQPAEGPDPAAASERAMKAASSILGRLGMTMYTIPKLFERSRVQAKANLLLALEDKALHVHEAVAHSLWNEDVYDAEKLTRQLDELTEDEWVAKTKQILEGKPLVILSS